MKKQTLLLLCLGVLSCGPTEVFTSDSVAAPAGDAELSLGRTSRLIVAEPLSLSASSVPSGSTLTGSVTYKNVGRTPYTLRHLSIEVRPPDGTHSDGPFIALEPALGATTVEPGATVAVTASRTFTDADQPGTWQAYSSLQRANGTTIDSPSVSFSHPGVAPQPDAGAPPALDAGMPPGPTGVFTVMANHIKNPDGTNFHGRGANLLDTRFCGVCGSAAGGADTEATRAAEVNRRLDDLVDQWKVTFIRLDLETLATTAGAGANGPDSVVNSPAYLQTVKTIVEHAATKPGLLLMLSIWDNGSLDPSGWPTSATNQELALLATTFKDSQRVMFGVSNEPQSNFSGALNAQAWDRMNAAVQAVRDAENAAGATVQHLVAVQGLGGWARQLDYFVTHPITAAGGVNVVYEIHVYDPATAFAGMFETFSSTLPIIIGEFGPASGFMTTADCDALMVSAEAHEIPYLAWQYGMGCGPDLLVNQGGCGIGAALAPTAWGAQLKARLATPW